MRNDNKRKRNTSRENIIYWMIITFTLLIFTTGCLNEKRNFLMIGIIGVFFGCLGIAKNISVFATAFLINFFVLLIGRFFSNWIMHSKSLIAGAFISGSPADKELISTFVLLVVSMLVFTLTLLFSSNIKIVGCSTKSFHNNYKYKEKIDLIINNWVYIAATFMFYIATVTQLAVIIEKVIYVQFAGSYVSYYTSFVRKLPYIIYKISQFYEFSFFLVLSLLESKRKTMPIIVTYLTISCLTLFYGQRNVIVRSGIIVICYLLIRNKINPEENWFNKKKKRLLIVGAPFVIIFLQILGRTRNGIELNFGGIFQELISFFRDEGTTSVVVYDGLMYAEQLPKDNHFFLGPIIEIVKYNPVSNILFEPKVFQAQTVEMALHGNSFGSSLLYIVQPNNYLAGLGLGTCYISEAFYDFGWWGLFFINFLYARILYLTEYRIENNKNIAWWRGMLQLIFVNGILYAPRDRAFEFISSGINVTVLFYIFLIYLISSIVSYYKSKAYI